MDWQQKEEIIINQVTAIFEQIIQENPTLPISVSTRGGAEISYDLESMFVKKTSNLPAFKEVEVSLPSNTKSPYDLKFIYEFYPGEQELVWIDIKATNLKHKDSNPDMGTYKKFLDFFKKGNYFALYCQIAYRSQGTGMKFVETPQGKMVHVFMLKDIHHSFRIQPNNQLQVNYAVHPEKRSLLEFIDLLQEKLQQSLERGK
ncbi:hypothetical protein PL8927_740019 [Planktothrix serta PCC 8927]|uniref:Restriction endonuclease n=1 Tax=Planktothrix serta PCC 8927 TaxID=671068 RepID=A0A7Z9BT24_9CYAN|nr:hypothetical protein [Planktothrix serta]VXD22214.1 hypothetical protein PL8927_740019 [Planktothrix serta PCC 8927]